MSTNRSAGRSAECPRAGAGPRLTPNADTNAILCRRYARNINTERSSPSNCKMPLASARMMCAATLVG